MSQFDDLAEAAARKTKKHSSNVDTNYINFFDESGKPLTSGLYKDISEMLNDYADEDEDFQFILEQVLLGNYKLKKFKVMMVD